MYPKTNILFDENYLDKVFLNSMLLNSNLTKLIRRCPSFCNSSFWVDENAKSHKYQLEVDIVGLSTEGDKHIINDFKKETKYINVYCNSLKSYNSWKNELKDYLGRLNFYCNHSYQGF